MTASAADIRSVLAVSETSTPGPSQAKKPQQFVTRKPEGISRELYSLIGPSAPSLVAQLAKPQFKQKPNLGGGSKVKWYYLDFSFALEWSVLTIRRECRPFGNSARQDSLKLRHWVKSTTEADEGTNFSLHLRRH